MSLRNTPIWLNYVDLSQKNAMSFHIIMLVVDSVCPQGTSLSVRFPVGMLLMMMSDWVTGSRISFRITKPGYRCPSSCFFPSIIHIMPHFFSYLSLLSLNHCRSFPLPCSEQAFFYQAAAAVTVIAGWRKRCFDLNAPLLRSNIICEMVMSE